MASGGGVDTDILSDETFDVLCTMCKRKNKNREAEKYCVDCQDYYCITCVKVHDDVPSLNGHVILDKGQFPSGSRRVLPLAPTERCDRHSHKHVDMYCQKHDEVGCSTCMAVDHRSCKETFYIPEFLQSGGNTSTSTEIQRKLDSAAKNLTNQLEHFQRDKQQLLKRKTETLKNIKKFRKEINDRLDELEKSSVDEIESISNALISEIEKGIKLLQTNKSAVQSARDRLVSSCKNVSQAFVNAKKGNHIAVMTSKSTGDATQIPVVDIDFVAERKLTALLEEMNALGSIAQRNVKNKESMASSTSTVKYQQVSSTKNTKQKEHQCASNVHQRSALLRGKGKKKYSVQVKSDKSNCYIVSACTLDDGTIILSDYSNNKLKILDISTFTVTDSCDLPGGPWQVCPISKQEVAVTLPNKQVVQFISVGASLTKTKQINTDFVCCGLAYCNGNLYISDYGTSVYIYSVSGSKLKLLNENKPGQELFSAINSLAVSKDGSRIYVCDFDKGLIVLDNNGQVIKQYNGPQLKSAYGCYLTATGSLLVCGRHSHNVLQFGPDGDLIGEVVKSDENKCYKAVCCNQQMSKMIVSSYADNNIDVYDLV